MGERGGAIVIVIPKPTGAGPKNVKLEPIKEMPAELLRTSEMQQVK